MRVMEEDKNDQDDVYDDDVDYNCDDVHMQMIIIMMKI